MKNLTKILILFFVCAAAIYSQDDKVTKAPGYIEFGDLSSLESGEMVAEVLLEKNLLKMVSKFTKNNEPDVSALIGGIDLIKVNVYEVTDANKQSILKKQKEIEKEITNKNWDRIVKVRDKGENANVYIKTLGEDDIVGLLVMTMDDEGEAAFVNIVGKINLETIGRLSEKFDIPGLDDINGKKE